MDEQRAQNTEQQGHTTEQQDTAWLKRMLAEREKELDGVYRLATLFSQPAEHLGSLIDRTAEILRTSMQFPEATGVHINLEHESAHIHAYGEEVDGYTVTRTYSIDRELSVSVRYHREGVQNGAQAAELTIDDRERRLIDTTATLLANVLQRFDTDEALRESTRALQTQADQLEHKNIALREVLGQIEQEKQEMLARSQRHLNTFVTPLLQRLQERSELSDHDREALSQLSTAIDRLFSDIPDGLGESGDRLSPRELEICGLIRGGMASKEIAAFLSISDATVERHRNTIRRKLGLAGRPVNLTSWLRTQG